MTHDVRVVGQFEAHEDLVLSTLFVKVIGNIAAHFFHGEQFLITSSPAFFYGSIASLN